MYFILHRRTVVVNHILFVSLLLNFAAQDVNATQPIEYNEELEPVIMEKNTDRLGSDYNNFDLPRADPGICRDACAKDAKCKAWTYVKPNTVQGPQPRCWLKYAVPPPIPNNCCVSGVKAVIIQQQEDTINKSVPTEEVEKTPDDADISDDLGEL